MKKLILCAIVSFATTVYAQEVMMPQYVITECGTMHQIPADSTPEAAIAWLDFWTSAAC